MSLHTPTPAAPADASDAGRRRSSTRARCGSSPASPQSSWPGAGHRQRVAAAAQALVFALGAVDQSPYGLLFRRFVRPRLGPPAELEDARPPRFAQALGLAFALVGVVGIRHSAATLSG